MRIRSAGDNARSMLINRGIGIRLRQRRKDLGVTQKELGDRIGLTYQQIQKFESGKSRIAAVTLVLIADVLNTRVSYFFEDLLCEEGIVKELD